ncbi:unnamed protein product [Tenebrio molitor]|nr:unnamed protein product [Tenebrio molitor]
MNYNIIFTFFSLIYGLRGECDINEEYQNCARPCIEICQPALPPQNTPPSCNDPCYYGCGCKKDYVRLYSKTGLCIHVDECHLRGLHVSY